MGMDNLGDLVDDLLSECNRLGSRRPAHQSFLDARRHSDWFRMSVDKDADTADLMIYEPIGWWGTRAKDFVTQLRDLDVSRINLSINSPGGDVYDGLAIYSALLSHKAKVVATVDGLAASAASFILQAADERRVAKHAEVMIHDAWGLAIGNAADMQAMADLLNRASANIAGIYADAGTMTAAEYRDLMLAETWFTADEAVDAGLADSVDDPKRGGDDGDASDRWDLSVFSHAGRAAAGPPPQQRTTRKPPDPDGIRRALQEAFR
jgi:ATP-dependent Clp endopeptidase proteolytic subunit ClpP